MKSPKGSDKTKHAQTDNALYESEQRFKTLAEATFEGIAISENGIIVDLNDQHAYMHGYEREDLIGKHVREIVAPEFHERLAEAMRTADPGPVEYLDLRKDGTRFPVEVLSRPMQVGKRELVIAAVRDITERKKAEEALQNERNLLRTLIDNLPDMVYVKDTRSRKLICNLADVHNMHLQSEADAIGKDDFELFPEELAKGFFVDDQTVMRSGKPVINREEFVYEESGKKRWLLTTKVPLKDGRGQIGGLVGISRDISIQKRYEEALRTSEAQLSNAMKMAKLGHWEYDVAKDTFTFNDNFYRIFRTTAEREGGYTMSSAQYAKRFVHPDEITVVADETRKAIESTDPNFSRQLEHRMIYADGEVGYIAVRFFIVKDEHGRTIKTYGVNQDITERKRMEKALQAQAEQYSALLATTADGFWLADENGKLIDVNEAYCRLSGYSREELLKLSISDLEASEATKETTNHIRKIIEQGSDRFETKHRTKDGRSIDVEISTTYLPSKKCLIVFTHDITKRKRAERVIRESEERFRNLFENAAIGIYCTTPEGRILLANPAIVRMLGFNSYDELVKRNVTEIGFDPRHPRSEFRDRIEKEGTVVGLESAWMRSDGSTVFLRESGKAIRDSEGKTLYYEGTVEDITERKRAEESLQRERNLLRTLIDNIPELIYVKDTAYRKSISNAADVRYMGLRSEAEALGKTDFDIYPKEVAEKFYANDKMVIENGQALLNREECARAEDGSERWLLTSKIPLRDEKGQVTGLVGIGRDITKYKQVQEALRTSEARLSNAVKMAHLGHWEYDVAKDLFTFNDHFYNIFRTTVEQVGSYTMSSAEYARRFVHPDDAPLVGEEVRKAIETTDPNFSRHLEHRMMYADGEIGHIAVRFFIVKDEHGRTIKTYGVNQDITERKRAEETLAAERNLLRTLIDALPDLIYVKDAGGRFLLNNASHIEALGAKSQEEIVGKTDFDFQQSEFATEPFTDDQNVIKSGKPVYNQEDAAVFPTGATWLSTTRVPLRDPQGNVLGLVAIRHDITDRKWTEEALRASENHLSNAVKMARLGHWEYDVAKDLFTFNDHFYSIFRTTAEREGGYTMSSAEYAKRFVHPDEITVVADETRKAIESTDPNFSRQLEHRMIYADGEVGYIAVRFNIVKDEQGRTIKTYGVNQDITERKRTEQALQERETKLKQIFDTVKDGIVLIDQTGKVLEANKSIETIVGFSPDEVLGRSFMELNVFESEDLATLSKLFSESVAQVSATQPLTRIRARHRDGHQIYVEANASLMKDVEGQFEGFLAAIRDITERKRAEEKIAEQARLLDVALDPIILQDTNDSLIYWNKAAERLYGWSFEEAKLLNMQQFIAEEERPRYDRARKEFLEKGECEIELHQKAKNGRSIITHSRWTLVRNDDGTPRGRLIITRDLTEQRNLEAQLRRAQRLESLGTLAGGIAHDLNNMLAPILMSIQILNTKTSDPNLKKLIGSLENSTKRGSEIIKQVLTFARGIEQDFAPQQLRYVISEIESIIKETFPRNIQLRTGIAKDLSLVLGDATQLHQVLINLCVNARDAMPDGGRLTLAAEDMVMDESYARMMLGARPGRYVMLTIADTGTGIPKDIQDQVFEPFFTTKEKGKGTGLGLSTVYAIVKSHSGLIKLYSEVGKGTEFKIFLPAIQKEEKEKPRPAAESALIRAKGERVLVIDDELSVLQISKEILELQGYTVLTAADGAEATALFAGAQKGSISLVITDMNMPLMDGSSTIRALRRIDPALKIVVSSGLLTDVNSAGVAGLEIQGYLTKPYTSAQLLLMVQKVLFSGHSPQPQARS
jgi:PAS domain S-box-containing protein